MKKELNSHIESVSDFEQKPLQVSRRRFLTGAGARIKCAAAGWVLAEVCFGRSDQ